MAAEPPEANWALATKLTVTSFVIDPANGRASRADRTASATARLTSLSALIAPPKRTGDMNLLNNPRRNGGCQDSWPGRGYGVQRRFDGEAQ